MFGSIWKMLCDAWQWFKLMRGLRKAGDQVWADFQKRKSMSPEEWARYGILREIRSVMGEIAGGQEGAYWCAEDLRELVGSFNEKVTLADHLSPKRNPVRLARMILEKAALHYGRRPDLFDAWRAAYEVVDARKRQEFAKEVKAWREAQGLS